MEGGEARTLKMRVGGRDMRRKNCRKMLNTNVKEREKSTWYHFGHATIEGWIVAVSFQAMP